MADVLVAALSARSLAEAARRAGYVPLAADLFDDLDLRARASATARVAGDLATGFEWPALEPALRRLASQGEPVGVVCGSGFEDRPELLDRIAARWRLLGNAAATVAAAKDPARLAEICGCRGIPHPRWSVRAPPGGNWLGKRRGGSGGAHVGGRMGEGAAMYFQERVEGGPVSALLLADGETAMLLGLSEQWASPGEEAPWRYGGAARPANIGAAVANELADAATAIVEALRLVGLNSVDFLVNGDDFWLIEVNPRPGATLDIFDDGGVPLFALHVDACLGRLPRRAPVFSGGAAAAVVYARRAIASFPAVEWPAWCADRQPGGTPVAAGAPVCTVRAGGANAAEARRQVGERCAAIGALVEAVA
jgi:predicted ATP-grasp superfamily ATP-dependent carboligase